MADFINFEADIEDIGEDEGNEVSDISDVESENSFIDNQDVNTDANFYRHFANVENDIEQVLKDTYNEELEDIETFDQISSLCEGSGEESEIDNFNNFEVDVKKTNETLFPRVDVEDEKVHNQFSCAILYALRFDNTGFKDKCDKEEFERNIDQSLIEKLNQPEKFECILDLQKFHDMCYEINSILSKHNYFLRVFELKNKYRRFSMKDKSKQKIVRQLSSCLIEKYRGFRVISMEFEKKQRKLFKPIDIIYKPTKSIETEPLCYFSDDISKAYSSSYSKGKEMRRAHKCYQCCYCNKFFIQETRLKRHMANCSGGSGVVYNFNNQNLITYQDNFYAKGDVPFIIYFDFETTAPTDNCLDPEQKTFVVSYVTIVAFNPELKLDRIIIHRSFAHSVEQLTSLNYFTREQITFIDQSLIKMLKGMAFEVAKRRCKNSTRQMFSIESALVKKLF